MAALAERPVLAKLWESSRMGTYGNAARDRLLGACRCLWVLQTSPGKALMVRLGISVEASAGDRYRGWEGADRRRASWQTGGQ